MLALANFLTLRLAKVQASSSCLMFINNIKSFLTTHHQRCAIKRVLPKGVDVLRGYIQAWSITQFNSAITFKTIVHVWNITTLQANWQSIVATESLVGHATLSLFHGRSKAKDHTFLCNEGYILMSLVFYQSKHTKISLSAIPGGGYISFV